MRIRRNIFSRTVKLVFLLKIKVRFRSTFQNKSLISLKEEVD